MHDPKAILLCNNRYAIPAIRELAFFNQLAAIVVPAQNRLLIEELEPLTGTVPFEKASAAELAETLKRLAKTTQASCGIILGFPFRIRPEALAVLPHGLFNFHFGPLPKYRGPEPLFAQIKNGETFTAVVVHRVIEKMDEGPVCLEERVRIHETESYGMLQSKLAWISASLARQLLQLISFGGKIPERAQTGTEPGWHKKPGFGDVMIRWQDMSSAEIQRLVNACNPWNRGAGARCGEQVYGILEVEIIPGKDEPGTPPGTIVSLNSGGLFVSTLDGKQLKLNVLYTPDGFFSGARAGALGLREGDRFIEPI
jgi:methionyl-tRNA formyltransferase